VKRKARIVVEIFYDSDDYADATEAAEDAVADIGNPNNCFKGHEINGECADLVGVLDSEEITA
jgi:hypothetical protein